MSKIDNLHAMRHSLAHIMATAIQHLWPEAKFGVGPVVENGFYYDVDLGSKKLSEEDFATLEKEMTKVIKASQAFEKSELSIDKAIDWAKKAKQPYKLELLNDLKRSGTTVASDLDVSELGLEASDDSKVENVSFYTNGDFVDLCRGPHVENTGQVGAFKLQRVSGAYWRGQDTNPQMQRIYGVAFATQEELDDYLKMMEEAKSRDHRKLGQELDLFVFSELVGPGLPLWTPRGTVIRNELDRFVQEMRDEHGFEAVTIPHITKKDLYVKSGHWAKFSDELFKIKTRDGHEFAMKPMNCPHHTQIYASRPRSYRELPVRYRETTMVYRDEQTGELGGLSRVRSITQDDAHIFCRYNQIQEEALKVWEIIERFYSTLDMKLRLRLSFHDPKNQKAYMGDSKKWHEVEAQLTKLAESKIGKDYELGIGEAAFYGPKLDFMAQDAIGREHQVATIQLDFNQPEGFDLNCVNEEGALERIVMIHCAIAGSLERCMSVLIEHFAGRFPVWLSPEQIRIISINQEDVTVKFAQDLLAKAKKLGLRATVDNSNDTVGKKIRAAELQKVPYTVVVGPKEIESKRISPRVRKDMSVTDEHTDTGIEEFLSTVVNEAKGRVHKSSF